MHPVVLLIVHLAAYGAGVLMTLFLLLFTSGPSVQAGERSITLLLTAGVLGALVTTMSLHRRLPADYGIAARLGFDALALTGAAVILVVFGVFALVAFNR